MKQDKENKVQSIINFFENKNYFVDVKANGHIKVLGVDFWCTTEKWYHARKGDVGGKRGLGLPSFVKYLEHLQEVE